MNIGTHAIELGDLVIKVEVAAGETQTLEIEAI